MWRMCCCWSGNSCPPFIVSRRGRCTRSHSSRHRHPPSFPISAEKLPESPSGRLSAVHKYYGRWKSGIYLVRRLLDPQAKVYMKFFKTSFSYKLVLSSPLPGGLSFLKAKNEPRRRTAKKPLEKLMSARPTHHTPPSWPTSCNTASPQAAHHFSPTAVIAYAGFQNFDFVEYYIQVIDHLSQNVAGVAQAPEKKPRHCSLSQT